jgi:hypothetical protein
MSLLTGTGIAYSFHVMTTIKNSGAMTVNLFDTTREASAGSIRACAPEHGMQVRQGI